MPINEAKIKHTIPLKKRNLTEGPIAKQLVIFALPLMLANLLQQLLNTTDALIVGILYNTEALTGITQAGRVIFMLNSVLLGIGIGAGVVISHFYGARDKENFSKAIHSTIFMGLILGL
ncbi:MAG: MATE family efflux transporter, partial [Firmicutes bacterium]|nr:MATE family efflux transporter [Bacillota bacterium]